MKKISIEKNISKMIYISACAEYQKTKKSVFKITDFEIFAALQQIGKKFSTNVNLKTLVDSLNENIGAKASYIKENKSILLILSKHPRQTRTNKIIIDFEFNGLPRYNFEPEITQVKMKNLTNGKSVCQNFKTHNKGFGRGYYGLLTGEEYFSRKEFVELLETIDASEQDAFYGFSIETDKELLCSYDINLSAYVDIQEQLMLKKKYEVPMAMGGRSLEFCYYLVTKEVVTVDHNTADELALIERLFYATRGKKQKYLTVYPWGEEAGMPLEDYIDDNRRRADGYRYNNNNILSKSLDHYIEREEEDCNWDD